MCTVAQLIFYYSRCDTKILIIQKACDTATKSMRLLGHVDGGGGRGKHKTVPLGDRCTEELKTKADDAINRPLLLIVEQQTAKMTVL